MAIMEQITEKDNQIVIKSVYVDGQYLKADIIDRGGINVFGFNTPIIFSL